MTSYRMYVNGTRTETVVAATNPTKAARQMCEMHGLTVATQSGRYVTTTDGQSVAAMTAPVSRTRYADHGTTRL